MGYLFGLPVRNLNENPGGERGMIKPGHWLNFPSNFSYTAKDTHLYSNLPVIFYAGAIFRIKITFGYLRMFPSILVLASKKSSSFLIFVKKAIVEEFNWVFVIH